MSAQTIYMRLVQAGMSSEGACAMLGNMQAESALRANNVQDGHGFTDEEYTARVDAGKLNFIDGIGYGLCQWTFGERKRRLLRFARERGLSVGDEDMQVDFCVHELKSEYPGLWLYLCETTGVYQAAERICTEFERPAVNNVYQRAAFANQFYMQLGGMEPPQSALQTTPPEREPAGGESTGGASLAQGQLTSSLTPEEVVTYWPPRILAIGMYGPDVVALQGLLIAHGYPAGISGQFDKATDGQLRGFQKTKKLEVDGIAGPLSWAALTARR